VSHISVIIYTSLILPVTVFSRTEDCKQLGSCFINYAHWKVSRVFLISYRAIKKKYPPKNLASLTLILLTWRIWRAPNNASRSQMAFKTAFKGLNTSETLHRTETVRTEHTHLPKTLFRTQKLRMISRIIPSSTWSKQPETFTISLRISTVELCQYLWSKALAAMKLMLWLFWVMTRR